MSRRLRRRLTVRRVPQYGDEVYIPSDHADGHWCNGIVNSGLPGGRDHTDARLLVAAPGHRMSNLVSVPIGGYRKYWCWPEDVNRSPLPRDGVKAVPLDELQG